MATLYESIYDRFLSKITDYELASLVDEELTNQLSKYLKSAITDFKYCTLDLSDRNDVTQTFNIDLKDDEQEILAKFMLIHWITPNILRLENIRQAIGNRDFSINSSANHLDKLLNLKKDLLNDVASDMIYYYYAT